MGVSRADAQMDTVNQAYFIWKRESGCGKQTASRAQWGQSRLAFYGWVHRRASCDDWITNHGKIWLAARWDVQWRGQKVWVPFKTCHSKVIPGGDGQGEDSRRKRGLLIEANKYSGRWAKKANHTTRSGSSLISDATTNFIFGQIFLSYVHGRHLNAS